MVIINGKSYPGNSVAIIGSQVIIDGKKIDDPDLPKTILQIDVRGDLVSLDTDASVNCDNIQGNVSAGGSINCNDIRGNVSAGGSINCDSIGGSASAGGSIVHG